MTTDQLKLLTEWRTRVEIAERAAKLLEAFPDDVARVVDAEDGSFGEALDLAETAVNAARASLCFDPNAPDTGAAALVRALGGQDSAITVLLGVIRTLCEVAP